MIDAGDNGKPAVSLEELMAFRSKAFDSASQVAKGVFFTIEQKAGALMAADVHPKNIEVNMTVNVEVKRKGVIQIAQPPIPKDMKRL